MSGLRHDFKSTFSEVTIEIVVTPREIILVGLALAISEKIPAWLYSIIGLVAAY